MLHYGFPGSIEIQLNTIRGLSAAGAFSTVWTYRSMVNLLYYTRRVPQNRKMAREMVLAPLPHGPKPVASLRARELHAPKLTYKHVRTYIVTPLRAPRQQYLSQPHPLHPHQANQAIHVATPTVLKRSSFLQHPAEFQARTSCHIRSLFSSAVQKKPIVPTDPTSAEKYPRRILRPVKASHGSVIQYISK